MADSYNLLIDIGNTLVKWGRYRITPVADSSAAADAAAPPPPRGWAHENCIEFGTTLLDEIPSLIGTFRRATAPRHTVVSNVAGTKVRNTLMHVLEIWPDVRPAFWFAAQEQQCGVTNGYRNPAQLGTDRWAAMIGARALLPDQAVLVVVCGTATTIDLISPEGKFVGGNIMPGVGLMLRSLHTNTATLPDADGDYVDHPSQTVDAIVSGCHHAQAGAIERLYRRHRAEYHDLMCIISGGSGRALVPRLTIPHWHHDNLVLEGLYRISQSLT